MAFGYRRSITIDHTLCGSGNTSHFPFLFSTTDATFKTVGNGGKVQNASGYDLVFYSDITLTTILDFEVEKYVATSGKLIAWIRIPTLSVSSDVVIYLAYGNASISTFQGNVTGTWGDGGSGYFKLVQHFPGDEAGGTPGLLDSTSNANNGTNSSCTSSEIGLTSAPIDGAITPGATGKYTIADSASLRIADTDLVTIEFWWNGGDNGTVRTVLQKFDGTTGYQMYFVNSDKLEFPLYGNLGASNYITAQVNTTGPNTGAHHAFVTYDGSGLNTGINITYDLTLQTVNRGGTLSSTTSSTTAFTGVAQPGGSLQWNGSIDELRISKGIVRSTSYNTAGYNNQSAPSTFYALGSEVAISTGVAPRIIITG